MVFKRYLQDNRIKIIKSTGLFGRLRYLQRV